VVSTVTGLAELGPEPSDRQERSLWREERRGALVLLAALADYDPALLRRAMLDGADDRLEPGARELLLDAARSECSDRGS
jgi:hypothetical protein